MRTLRDSVGRGTVIMGPSRKVAEQYQAIYRQGVADALCEYGSYRVVEGVLVLASPGNLVVALEVDDTNPHRDVKLGILGNHVKLLLPPEEKKPLGAKVAIDTAMALVREHAARADRYEKALREIARRNDYVRIVDKTIVLRRIAEEALDGTDTE